MRPRRITLAAMLVAGIGCWWWAATTGAGPAGKPAPLAAVPDELTALNVESRNLYKGGRAAELANVGPIIFVLGDDLTLKKGDTRTTVTVIPPEYHALKSVAHVSLALFAHLNRFADQPLPADRLATLTAYRDKVAAAGPAVEKCGFDADTLARQKRLIDRGLAFIDQVVKDGKVSAADLTRYCRTARPDLMANCAAAARAQLTATHKQVMGWKKGMTADEWDRLIVVVQAAQTPRVQNAAVQYFTRLLGEPGEGGRVVYAESLYDEDKALALTGTRLLDRRLSVAVFGDPGRMFIDILADSARVAVDDILAAP